MRSTACRSRKSQTVRSSTCGTKLSDDQRVVTNGGRVLCVTALGDSVAQAQQRAYQLLTDIRWDGSFSRSDIGWRAIEREKANG